MKVSEIFGPMPRITNTRHWDNGITHWKMTRIAQRGFRISGSFAYADDMCEFGIGGRKYVADQLRRARAALAAEAAKATP